MKKLVAYCFVLFAGIGLFYLVARSDHRETMSSLIDVNLVNKSSTDVSYEDLSNERSVIGVALNEARPLEAFETAFSNLSRSEINSKLSSSDRLLKEDKIFQQANSSNGLDQVTAIKLIELMRSRQALNKILIDRQLDHMRRKRL
jgi:hypothetical protein